MARLGPEEKVRAIVMLRAEGVEVGEGHRQSRTTRQAAVEMMRKTAGESLGDIDRILESFQGKRLAAAVNALGTVPVETTPAGIEALAGSECVRSILEDQKISLFDNRVI